MRLRDTLPDVPSVHATLRRGPGRPRFSEAGKCVRINVTVRPEDAEWMEQHGGPAVFIRNAVDGQRAALGQAAAAKLNA